MLCSDGGVVSQDRKTSSSQALAHSCCLLPEQLLSFIIVTGKVQELTSVAGYCMM